MQTIGTPGLWLGFLGFVVAMLAVDLGIFHRKAHTVSLKEAAAWTGVWIFLALVFNAGVYLLFGPERGLEFATGYLLEKALAMDNIFVIVVIFSYFAVPALYQHRVLFWGIIGALVMRAGFIVAGASLLARFHWVMYVFGGVLLITGIKLLVQKHDNVDPGNNVVVRFARRFLPLTDKYHEDHFFVRQAGKWVGTPLFLTLLVVELTDVIFAVDSIPAIFAVTRDPFIVFTSNIFAILGLRSMYFLLAGIVGRFVYLKTGLSVVLIFVAAKMLLLDVYKIPIGVSLGVVAALIGGSIGLSLLKTRNQAPGVLSSAG